YDVNNDGVFQPETSYNGPLTIDQVVATTTFVNGVATFGNLNLVISPVQSKNYFVAVRISTNAQTGLPANLGLKILDPTQITVNGLGVANNNFAMVTSTSPVVRQPATIRVVGQDISAYWDPGTGLAQQNFVFQGQTATGMLRLSFWTDAFQGAIHQLRVT